MKILLVKPNSISDGIVPPLGLGYLAAAITNESEIAILDGIKTKLSLSSLESYVKEYNPDVVGLQLLSQDINTAMSYLNVVKRINPGVVTIAGGPHPTAVKEELFDHLGEYLDYAFAGECEIGFPIFINSLEGNRKSGFSVRKKGEIPGLIWREDDPKSDPSLSMKVLGRNPKPVPLIDSGAGSGQVQESEIYLNPPAYVKNLDTVNPPAWDLMPPNKYPRAPHGAFYRKFPIAPISISRGCPYNCAFCILGNKAYNKIRYRSLKNVMEEIQYLYKSFGIREIHIIDDNFTLRREYAMNFCERLLSSGLNISWACPNGVRHNSLDRDLLKKMKASGCYAVSIGIESGSKRILSFIKKDIDLKDVEEKVGLINEIGMESEGFFMLGLPTETPEDIKKTIDLSLKLKLKKANFMFYHPFPGTGLFDWIQKNHPTTKFDYRSPYSKASYIPVTMSARELKSLQRRAFLKFYLRPGIMKELLKDIRSPGHLYHIFMRCIRWML